ncbi:hypothetical protein [Agarivorans gilvus]|uniref:Uncharacterized protein n=1 Tax=Agarivorans gilvus TaxID=680279 RepID=A0ABQ1I3V4_9ALTE|nr:hypothetical protein [Agarivorans gilvus]GGB06270.1 hypothetical protein GCM10007414_19440 [Agarivorans gilvus]
MNTKLESEQGYQHKERLYVEANMLKFIEQQLLVASQLSARVFFDTLTTLLDEFGATYRRLNQQSQEIGSQQHLQQAELSLRQPMRINISAGNSKAVLDEHACATPSCILDALITTLLAEQQQMILSLSTRTVEEAQLFEAVFKRAHHLLGYNSRHIEVNPPVDNVSCIAQARKRAEYVATEGLLNQA